MDISKVLAAAAKVKATEARVEIGEPTLLIVRGETRTLFASTVKADDFENGVIQRLNAFAREQLRATGRCEWQYEEKGVGKIRAEVEPTKARFLLPMTSEVQSSSETSDKLAPGESKPGLLGRLLGRK